MSGLLLALLALLVVVASPGLEPAPKRHRSVSAASAWVQVASHPLELSECQLADGRWRKHRTAITPPAHRLYLICNDDGNDAADAVSDNDTGGLGDAVCSV